MIKPDTERRTLKIQKTKFIELLFFIYLSYAMLSPAYGIYIPYFAPALLLVLACLTLFFYKFTKEGIRFFLVVGGIVASFLFIQVFYFDSSLTNEYLKFFPSWLIISFLIMALSGKPGFINRLFVVLFIIGMLLFPTSIFHSWSYSSGGSYTTFRLNAKSGIDNTNDYAQWMGFCTLGFWLWIWKSKQKGKIILLLALAFISLTIMLMTISRGTIISLGFALIVSLRNIRIRKWHVILLFLLLLITAINLPFFQNLFSYYDIRWNIDTGRISNWPLILKAIMARPILGYGVEQVSNITYYEGVDITPHNGIFLLWVSAGVIPVIIFLYLWFVAFRNSLGFSKRESSEIDPLPLIVYAFLTMLTGNLVFMQVWAIASYVLGFTLSKRPIKAIQMAHVKLRNA